MHPGLVTVHFDGKMAEDPPTQERKDNLAVVVTGNDEEHLSGVIEITPGTGEAEVQAVIEILTNNGLVRQIIPAFTDTTASNTGIKKGPVPY